MHFDLFYTENKKVACLYLEEIDSWYDRSGYTLFELVIVKTDKLILDNGVFWINEKDYITIEKDFSIKTSGIEVLNTLTGLLTSGNNIIYFALDISDNRELERNRLFNSWLNQLIFTTDIEVVEESSKLGGYHLIYKGIFRKNITDADYVKKSVSNFFKKQLGIPSSESL